MRAPLERLRCATDRAHSHGASARRSLQSSMSAIMPGREDGNLAARLRDERVDRLGVGVEVHRQRQRLVVV